MTKSKAPVSSFGPEIQATLRAGAQQELRITFDSPQLATRFNHRLNALRVAMKRENHADWQQLYRCGNYIDSKDKCTLVIGPKDAEFRKALAAAGVAGAGEPLPSVSVEAKAPSPDDKEIDTFFDALVQETSVKREAPHEQRSSEAKPPPTPPKPTNSSNGTS